ncbi:DNA topoisomerase I [candidate division TM6 bacterium RIFCSPHIGHO2_12_FULL_32_22]|nr:MAG: DNA topoisomerase I [candidate division TM6 bacterium RIFCSPHIGHO2_12_FULL_32_22]
MKKLLIVESPSKIKTISKFLDKDFKIMATMGHIKDLPPKKLGVTINGSIDIDYVPIENKDKVIADICKEASKSNEVYLAPDPDREGEIIAWHIDQEIEKVLPKSSKVYRIAFNEITRNAVQEAIDNPSTIDLKKVAAQQARRVLDRWVGYEVSPILWRKIAKGLSAGRVQSVALRLICDREIEIQNFKPEEYWTIEGTFVDGKKATIFAMLTNISKKPAKIQNQKSADQIVAELKDYDYKITSIQDKERIKNPYPPFMTSSLQQAAYNRLGFSVKKTMQLAQQLYEGVPLEDKSPTALITYMRTDSLRIADVALKRVREFIDKKLGKEYLPSKANFFSKKTKTTTQDAHEAIRPIDVAVTPESIKNLISSDIYKLYDLIWKRFVACQMEAARYAQRQVTIEGGKYTFKVTGSTLIFDGFLKLYQSDEEDAESKEIKIPEHIKENDKVDLKKIDPKQHFTQAPPRYTEASLVKGLEKEGIGRPSTYATILNTIRARDYTNLEKKKFVPTELGMSVTNLLKENLPKIMDIKFTALMEEDLDKIAKGEMERDSLLREFYGNFQKDLESFKEMKGKVAEPTDIKCPECKKHNLVIRFGKAGEFLGCPGFPECKFTSNFKRAEDGKIELVEQKAAELTEEKCPNCSKPLRKVQGKFGEFLACSGYPECKYIHQEKAGYKCPECKKGELVKRVWKKGSFWGCSNYPKCKFAVFGQIKDEKCPKCKNPFMAEKVLKDQSIISCPNKECK